MAPTPIPGRGRVFAYVGLAAARERCRRGREEGNVFISRDYAVGVRRAFARLGPAALAAFDRTTAPPSLPERDLRVVPAHRRAGS